MYVIYIDTISAEYIVFTSKKREEKNEIQ